ncbi:MAG: hypothetical protein JXB09_03330 [Deltaproteobacteria bacterium]|nr:hypothetical protein [Deltaproteobacteria bacterium]
MVRSIDVQQILLQTNSVERVQQTQQQHPDVQQRYFEDQLSKEKKNMKEKVSGAEGLEELRIREEERRDSGDRHKRGKKKKEEEHDAGAGEVGETVDIRV